MIEAVSLSKTVIDVLKNDVFNGRVTAVFEHSVNLELVPACHSGQINPVIITLAESKVGDGPLNIVLDRNSLHRLLLQPGDSVSLSMACLQVGDNRITFGNARIHDPQPDWTCLRTDCSLSGRRLHDLIVLARRLAPAYTLLDALWPAISDGTEHFYTGGEIKQQVVAEVRDVIHVMEEAWYEPARALQLGTARLAGLGYGLTPAGDDFLLGLMLSLRLRSPSAAAICESLIDTATVKTTGLSAALLQRAARGECSPAWHVFLHALTEAGEDSEVKEAIQSLLVCGHTSGGDALAGFLWLAGMPVDGLFAYQAGPFSVTDIN